MTLTVTQNLLTVNDLRREQVGVDNDDDIDSSSEPIS